MGLVIFLVIAWLVLSVFFSLNNKLPARVNIILFLIIQIVHINFYTISSFTLKWFTASRSPVGFITDIVFRDSILPGLLLLFINLFYSTKRAGNRIVIALVIWLLLVVMGQLLFGFGFEHKNHWSIFYLGLFCLGMMAFSILIKVLLMKIYLKEKNRYDDPSPL
ncbi:hypothetical protein RCG19_19175 [Neobacillus sp. OS1-2]|uniref:hypothetical protein n=1 Tax=Neobacillus sp. OS1-2 TaxID=3070680 RepID=UPI0027E20EFB|nr:hypothetical protein [Neobacillus sp. OS1-2]WML39282.1 hypothetical protein RCG19_19175 [Neobacillus sp. OS1-2]